MEKQALIRDALLIRTVCEEDMDALQQQKRKKSKKAMEGTESLRKFENCEYYKDQGQ